MVGILVGSACDGVHLRADTEDVDHSHQIAGQNAQGHLGFDFFKGSGQEVGAAHPGLEGGEGMLDGLSAPFLWSSAHPPGRPVASGKTPENPSADLRDTLHRAYPLMKRFIQPFNHWEVSNRLEHFHTASVRSSRKHDDQFLAALTPNADIVRHGLGQQPKGDKQRFLIASDFMAIRTSCVVKQAYPNPLVMRARPSSTIATSSIRRKDC